MATHSSTLAWKIPWAEEPGGLLTNAVDMNLGKLWEMVRDWEAWSAAVREVTKSRTRVGD